MPYFIPVIVATALFPSIVRTTTLGAQDHFKRMSLYFQDERRHFLSHHGAHGSPGAILCETPLRA